MSAPIDRSIGLRADLIEALRSRLRGPLLVPGEAAYDESRALWNAMIERRPAFVVRCLGVADAVACFGSVCRCRSRASATTSPGGA